jgi:hypothetical protein
VTGIVQLAFLTVLAVRMLVPMALFLPFYARITQADDDDFLHSLQYCARWEQESFGWLYSPTYQPTLPDFTFPVASVNVRETSRGDNLLHSLHPPRVFFVAADVGVGILRVEPTGNTR